MGVKSEQTTNKNSKWKSLVFCLMLTSLVHQGSCQIPGAVWRGEGDGFYQMTTSSVHLVFFPSTDTYLAADLGLDTSTYPVLRRLILMDAAGNYLSEYSPTKVTFLNSNTFKLDHFADPTQSKIVLPTKDGLSVFQVLEDPITRSQFISLVGSYRYGNLRCNNIMKMLSIPFSNQLLILHDVPGNITGDLGMISKVELVTDQPELNVLTSKLLDRTLFGSGWRASLSLRNLEEVFVFGSNGSFAAMQIMSMLDLSVIATLRDPRITQTQESLNAVLQDSRRKDRTYLAASGGLYMVDLTDPTSPLLVNYFSTSQQGISNLQEVPGTSSILILTETDLMPEESDLSSLKNVSNDISALGDIIVEVYSNSNGSTQNSTFRRLLSASKQRKRNSRILVPANVAPGPFLTMLVVPKSGLEASGFGGQQIVSVFKSNSYLYLRQAFASENGFGCCSLKPNQTTFGLAFVSNRDPVSKSLMRVFSMVPMSECLALYCHECSEGPNICSLCFEGFALYQGSCITQNSLPAGTGIDQELNLLHSNSSAVWNSSNSTRIWSSKAIKPCEVKQCTDCKFNYKECKSCKAGRTLSNGVCNMELDTRLQALPSQSTETQLGYILELTSESSELPNLTASEYADLATNYLSQGWLTTGFSNSKNSTVISSTQQPRVRVKAVSATVYTVTVSYNRIPENTDTLVLSTNNTSGTLFNYSEGSLSLRRKNTSFVLDLQLVSSSDKIERFASLGGTVSALTLSTDNYAGSSILMVLMAFDFSGYLLRFAQIIKIVNKIRFFNLNYGPKLMAYLDALGDMFKILGPRDQSKDVYNSRAFRGRISRKYVDLEFSKVFSDKIPVYLISWFILLVNWVISLKNIVVPKFYLHVMKFHPKIHLIVFNILHIDFIFYGSRTLLHARGMHTDTNLAFLILVLVSADFFLLLNAIYSESAWLRTLTWARIEEDPVAAAKRRKELALRSDVEVVLPVEMEEQDKLDSTHLDNIEDTEINNNKTEKPEPNKDYDDEEKKPVGPKINYPLTYSRIDWMRQRAVLLATPLLLDDRVFANKGCRAHLIIHLMRVSAYQFLPICGQYASGLLITMLAMVEVVKIYHLWTTAGAFSYLKTKIAFVSELIQSMFLLLFLFLLFLMHFKDFGESVLDGPQLFCITLITIAVITEWLLTIVMLIIGLVFGKKKPAKGEKKQTTGIKISEVFIYYSKAEATDEPEQKQVISVVPKSKPGVSESTNQSSDVKQMIATRPADTLDGKIAELRIQPKVYSHDSESWSKDSQVLSTRRPVNKIIASNMGQSNLSKSHSNWNPNPQKEVSERILEYYKRRKLAT